MGCFSSGDLFTRGVIGVFSETTCKVKQSDHRMILLPWLGLQEPVDQADPDIFNTRERKTTRC